MLDQLVFSGGGVVHGEDVGQWHCPAELLCKAERAKLLVPGCRADISFQPKNANLQWHDIVNSSRQKATVHSWA